MSEIAVHVTPKSSSLKLARVNGGLKAWVHAAPSKDEANKALCRLVAEALDVPVSGVSIIRGQTSRMKTVSIPSLTAEEIGERLNSFVDSSKQ